MRMSTPLPDAGLVLAVDIGGTFTDVTLHDMATGSARTAKVPSTPSDPSEAFLAGAAAVLGANPPAAIARVLHGTTVATNMILEGTGAITALVTTQGFRHVLEIGRQDFPRRGNLWRWVKPPRPVPPARVFELAGRIGPDGTELAPLDEAAMPALAAAIRGSGAHAVAICLLHAWANPAHEAHAALLLRDALPGVAITASHEILPVVREYERSMAAALNAHVMPRVSTYVARLRQLLDQAGIAAPLLLMKSNGGVAGAAHIIRRPAETALSGPAAGLVGARAAAAACGIDDIITVDIGGTSADIALIKAGTIGLSQSGRVGAWPLALPMLDMVTIGAGGGSIARITADGALTVGPDSAGAAPGPACYGKGGRLPTLTDAHLALGHLPGALLGGAMHLDAALARFALATLGLGVEQAARGCLAIADNAMAGAIRLVSVERGHDPRDFTLVPFGGAGPLHGGALARLLGMRRILVPPAPGVLCAQGLLAADLRADFARSHLAVLPARDAAALHATFAALEAEAAAWFDAEAVAPPDRITRRAALMRHHDQGFELTVPWADDLAALAQRFIAAHEALYGFSLPHAAVEIVTLRVEATARLSAPAPARLPPGDAAIAHRGTQPVAFTDGTRPVPLYDRARLGAGATFDGPAIVTQLDATTLLLPGQRACVHPTGALLIEETGQDSGGSG
jgi:N-methylhydantoinase A